QVKKAISALYKYNTTKSDNDMLDSDEDNYVYVQISTHKIMNKASLKKSKIALKHSPYPDNYEICLITKESEKVMEDKIKSITPIKKAVSVATLKSTYKNYEARRKLCDSYDLFLVDDRVAHLMPKLLGKSFFAKNKAPIAIKTTNLKKSIEATLEATFVKLNNGVNTLITVGNFGMPQEQILDNCEAAIPALVKIVAHEWKQVNLISLKSQKSPSLPVYTALPVAEDVKEKKAKKVTKEVVAPVKEAAPVEKKAAPAKKAAAPKTATPKKVVPK
ncbi:50S ribosomal protein L1, partial [Mucor mucedo]|uniref:50S ribosomal protein L1 n=1 Tax=Mucor mucedo TaxID=29922 RepID=UPI00221EED3E